MRILALAFVLLAASGATAQPDWRPVPTGMHLSIDAYGSADTIEFTPSPDAIEVYDLNQRFAVALLTGHAPLSRRFAVTAALPMGFYDLETNAPEEFQLDRGSQFGVGNVYIGVISALAPEASAEVGVWLPTSTDGRVLSSGSGLNFAASNAGFSTDYEHRETYLQDFVSARVVLRGGLPVSEALRLRGMVSPVLAYTTQRLSPGSDQARTNAALVGGVFADGLLGGVTLTAGAAARYEPEQGSLFAFDELAISALGALAVENLPVRPGLVVRVPIVGDGGFSDVIVGASLGLPLR